MFPNELKPRRSSSCVSSSWCSGVELGVVWWWNRTLQPPQRFVLSLLFLAEQTLPYCRSPKSVQRLVLIGSQGYVVFYEWEGRMWWMQFNGKYSLRTLSPLSSSRREVWWWAHLLFICYIFLHILPFHPYYFHHYYYMKFSWHVHHGSSFINNSLSYQDLNHETTAMTTYWNIAKCDITDYVLVVLWIIVGGVQKTIGTVWSLHPPW